jgi:hypothetical protein
VTAEAKPHDAIHKKTGTGPHGKESDASLDKVLASLPSEVRGQVNAHKEQLAPMKAKVHHVLDTSLPSAKGSGGISADQLLKLADSITH